MKRVCLRKKTISRKYCRDFRTKTKGYGPCLKKSKKKIKQKVCAKYK